MENPWKEIPLDVYESHMSLDSVAQLQALNQIMKNQWQACPSAISAAALGVAGGNGLEHCPMALKTVIGIDINGDYLHECKKRFLSTMGERLQLIQMDISAPAAKLPVVDLLIANLLIEYVGVKTFCRKAAGSQAWYISCVIQQNDSCHPEFVSESPFQHQLAPVGILHADIDEHQLTNEFAKYRYTPVLREICNLPNGKQFLRLDYGRGTERVSQES